MMKGQEPVISVDFLKSQWIKKFQHPFMIKILNKLSWNMPPCNQSHLEDNS